MNRIFILVVLAITITSCRTTGYWRVFNISPETPEEKTYLESVWKTPLELKVTNEEAEVTWGRIQSFIGKYSTVKIQVATDYVIQTYNVEYEQFGYYVTKTPDVSDTTFSIRCVTEPTPPSLWEGYDYSKQAELNAHILAFYALTGELMTKFIKQ